MQATHHGDRVKAQLAAVNTLATELPGLDIILLSGVGTLTSADAYTVSSWHGHDVLVVPTGEPYVV